MKKGTPAFPSRQRGSETVEFALTSTLVFILLFGIIEFSLALFDKAVIANASREGARVGILYRDYPDGLCPGGRTATCVAANENPLVEQAVLSYAQNYVISPGSASVLDASDITINRTYEQGTSGIFDVGDQISVRIDYDFSFLTLPHLLADLVLNHIPAETVMIAE